MVDTTDNTTPYLRARLNNTQVSMQVIQDRPSLRHIQATRCGRKFFANRILIEVSAYQILRSLLNQQYIVRPPILQAGHYTLLNLVLSVFFPFRFEVPPVFL